MKNKLYKIKNTIALWYLKEKRIVAASFVCGFLITFSIGFYTKSYSDRIIAGLSENVIRFHVLANSDEANDQELKLTVRDAVINNYSDALSLSSSASETKNMLADNLDGIQELAQSVVKEQGYDYPVTVSLSKDSFPSKQYGDITLPAGKYDSLRIEIGESEGQNWWCVMFPPMCFVDVTKNETDAQTKEMLQSLLTEEEYMLLDDGIRENDETIKIKFKIVEWWQERTKSDESEEIIIVRSSEGYSSDESF